MDLFPDPNKIPEKCIRLVWDLLQPVQKRKQRKLFCPEQYRNGMFAKTYTTAELEELSVHKNVLSTLQILHNKKIIGLHTKEDQHVLVFGFWKPLLCEHKGMFLLYRKVYKMIEYTEMKKLKKVYLFPGNRQGLHIVVDKSLVEVSKETTAESLSALKKFPVVCFAENKLRNELRKGRKGEFPSASCLGIRGLDVCGILFSSVTVSSVYNFHYIYEVYITKSIAKVETALPTRETRGRINGFGLSELTKESNLYFPIFDYKFEKLNKPTPRKKLGVPDSNPKNTLLFIEIACGYLGVENKKFVGKNRKPFIEARVRLDELNQKRKPVEKVYSDYFRLLDTYGLEGKYTPNYKWWFSEKAWSVFIQVLNCKFPGGYF